MAGINKQGDLKKHPTSKFSRSQINIIDFNLSKFNKIYTKTIPFFGKYSLLGVKRLNLLYFCKIAYLMNDSIHLKEITKILEIKAKINK